MYKNLQAIVLAAGKSTRLNTGTTKLLQKICGQEMVLYATTLLKQLDISTTVVIGYQKDQVKETITKHHANTISFVVQEEPQGTGHAIMCTRADWKKDHILIMNGDAPLVTKDIIEMLYVKHLETNASISFVIAHNGDPSGSGYGRVLQENNSTKIVEANEFHGDIQDHCYINAGIYIVKKEFLEKNSPRIKENKKSREFYITDLIQIASDRQETITTLPAPFDQIRGINTFQELWAAEQVKRAELIKYWMDRGVRFTIAQNVHIDLNVSIGAGSHIGCGVHLIHGTKIGKNCHISEFSAIENSIVEDHATIHSHCIIKDSHIGTYAHVGPFAHVQEKSTIKAHAVIGNFVEVKRSEIGKESKAKHLTYIGDAHIGERVNIGAGTITCNHNGSTKQKTIIKDNAYVGSNNSLVAPITIEKNAFTAAGSVITDNVPEDALAIARSRQINKEGYAKKLRETKEETKYSSDPSPSFMGALKTNKDTTYIEG